MLFSAAGTGLKSIYNQILMFVLGPVLALAIFRIIIGPFLGEKGSKMLDVVWSSCLKIVVGMALFPVKILEHQFKNKRKKD